MWGERMSVQGVMEGASPYSFIIPTGTTLEAVGKDYLISVASIEVALNPITFSAEFRQTNSDIIFHIDLSGIPIPLPVDWYQQGYYASLSYRMADSWELGLRYSMHWDDANDRDGKGNAGSPLINQLRLIGRPAHEAWQRDITLSIRHDIFEDWIVKLEGHYMNGTAASAYGSGSGPGAKDWFLGAVKTSYAF